MQATTTTAGNAIREVAGGWKREDVERDTSWIHVLSPGEIDALEQALRHTLGTGRDLLDMSIEDFPLDARVRRRLVALIDETQGGFGLKLLRGFPVERWDTDALRKLFWGIGLVLGVARPQGKMSQFVSDVRDAGGTYRSSTGRGYNTRSGLDFHADGSDMVGLFCVRTARSGGSSLVSSSITAHNEMLRLRPDLVAELYAPLVFSRQGEQAPEEAPWYLAPVFGVRDGHFACRHIRNHIKGAQQTFPDVPRLTPQQTEALDLFDELLAREDLCYHMDLQPGDIQLLNNHIVLHSRTEYEDYPEPERKRHLFRLWLSLPQAQPLPEAWRDAYKDVDAACVRGGFRGIHITPEIRAFEARLANAHGMKLRIYPVKEAA
ncbi:TauD/TfdA family dioxygenase [Cupriavidus agavae]|uniref:TfdA family taurine catabolism dioxygenase TauD n=1 Tax=Cupriavidus agavae TaxID=1001822 RepID=A0A4Q7RSU7_9BURK|nr:TauD/TfdA family dioxygenase [Cupriavidus agavae]RZT36703.1 TfdA family taurine catabolism dioxygenase TauD [Cupriavidus agavae]